MRNARVSPFLILLLGGQVAAVLLLVWCANLFIDMTMTHVREGRLAKEAQVGVGSVKAELAALQTTTSALQAKVSRQAQRQCPSVQDIKDLASGHRLRIGKMERQNQTSKADTGKLTYAVICLGGLDDQVAFLRQLEEVYILQSDNIVLQRYNEDGTVLALGLNLVVQEP